MHTKNKQILALKISFLFIINPVLASDIVIDTTRTHQNTSLDTAANGTSVVNISTPNANGVSHNTFIQFNVPTQGTILNNADREVQTQLAGYIYGNENLHDGSASLILNEVSGTNRSHLNGYLEVAGPSADVIVANPNGVTVNGAGFINIPKATLTTGKVNFNGSKPIFDIDGGDIFIDGKGLDAKGTSSLELYTQAIKLNAKLHANDLKVVTGLNHIDENGEVTSTDSEGKERPTFSIDSTVLGGIYANAISLVGTQKGVGVNLPSEMLVQDRLEISSDGKIILGKVSVQKKADIRSKSSSIEVNEGIHAETLDLQALSDIRLHGNTGATGDLTLLGNDLYNDGLIAAGVNADFTQADDGLLSLSFTDNIHNNGILFGLTHTTIDTRSFINTDHSEVITGTLTMNASEGLKNSGFIHANDLMHITAGNFNNTQGTVEGLDSVTLNTLNEFLNQNGILFASNTLTLTTNTLNNIEGTIQADEVLKVSAAGDIDNSKGVLYSGAGTTVTAQTMNNEEGFIGSIKALFLDLFNLEGDNGSISGEGVTIHTSKIDSNNATILASNGLDIESSGDVILTNSSMLANDKLNLIAKETTLNGSTLYSADDLNMNVQKLNLNNTFLFAQNMGVINTAILNNSDSVVSATQMHINTATFNNAASHFYSDGGTLNITTRDIMNNNNGLISANDNLVVDAQSLDNRNGDMEAGKTLDVTSSHLQIDSSRFFAGNHLDVTSNISNIDAHTKFLSGDSMNLDFAGNLIHHGEILANGAANITVDGDLNNENSITANQALNIVADTLNNNLNNTDATIRGGHFSNILLNGDLNNYGFLTSSGNLEITATDINNYAGIAAQNVLTMNSVNLYNYHTVLSGTDMNLYIANLLRNHEDADIYAGNNLIIAKDKGGEKSNKVENISAKIESAGDMHISAVDISNISATEITTILEEINGVIDITCGNWGSFSCPDANIALDIDLMVIKAGIIQEYADNGVTLSDSELQILLTEEMLKQDRQAYILNMYKDTQTTADELYFYELTASLDSNEMIVKRTKPHKKEEFRKVDYTVTKETVDPSSLANHKEGEIISGHDLVIDADNILNRTSLIAASNDIVINGNLENIGVGGTESIDATINYSWKRKSDGGRGQLPISKFEIRDVEGVSSQILAGGTLTGNFGSLQNGMRSDVDVNVDPNAPTISTATKSTDDTQEHTVSTAIEDQMQEVIDDALLSSAPQVYDPSLEDMTLPTDPYGIFVANLDPDGPLIESNPEYTNYNNYVSSDYLLERLGYDGASQMRRLGDALYETQLVRDAIMAMTGKRFVGMAQNDNEQYINLMNAGIEYAREVGLKLGVPPTDLQLKNLKEDLVWMEEKSIQGQHVLVPVLYLAKDYSRPSDANINADRMELTVDGHLVNVGNIQSRADMNLRTGRVTNVKGKIEAGSHLGISTIGDLENLSAKIKGSSVALLSEQGSIINKTLSKNLERQHSVGKEEYTHIDQKATIVGTKGYLVLEADNQIENTGAGLEAKTTMVLKAKGGIDIKTLKDESAYDYTFSNGYAKGESVEHLQSNVQAGEQLSVLSDKNINLEAAKIDADNTYLKAKEKVNTTAAVDSKYAESYFEDEGVLSNTSTADMKLEQSVKGTEIQTGNLIVEANEGISLESVTANAGNSVQITSETGNVDFSAKDYTNASYHEESSSMLGGLISERSVDAVSETLLEGASTKAQNNIIVGGKEINFVASDVESKNGGIKLSATENVNIVSGMEAKSEEHIREESGFSLGFSSGRFTFAKEEIDSTASTSYTNKASTLKTNTLLIESGQDTNVIASDITSGDMRVDASRNFNVLSDKDITTNNEEHSTKEIGIEFTLNSEEASVFAGYWEDKNSESSTDSKVVSSNINVGNLEVNSESSNVIGSNIAGEEIKINSENIRILSDSTNTNADAYTKSIKVGIEVGVKQNLSNTVNAIANVGEAESGSAVVARGLQAYDAVQSFSEQPVTAGVNAIYEESSTDMQSSNSQVVASSITATNTLALHASNELEIAGSDVGSANTLTINANDINIHASQGAYSTETSSETKNANVGLYGTRMGQSTVGYQESEMTTTGTTQRNSQLYAGGTATVTSTHDTTLSGASIDANDLTLNVGGDLTMESLQDTQSIDGSSRGGSISGNLLTMTPTGASANAGETSGERAMVTQVTGINGRENISVNVGGTTTLTGAGITNVDENGIDQGNLEVNTQHLVLNDIRDIDTYDATTAGVGAGSNDGAPGLNSVEYTNNTKEKEQITRATIGMGTINTGSLTGTLNRDTTTIQVITKDEESNTEIYVSDRSLELVKNPNAAVASLGNKLKDVGLASLSEIRSNLPTAEGKKDKDGNPISEDGTIKNVLENFIDDTLGQGLDMLGGKSNGIVPSVGNEGGYITQIATQLTGDNRNQIIVKDKSKLESLELTERDPNNHDANWDYEQYITEKGEVAYRTNPNKTVRIDEDFSNHVMDDYKINITSEDIQRLELHHVFTNGMANSNDEAINNQQSQQGKADGILNFNPSHGGIADMIQNIQDDLAVSLGIGNLGTGSAYQTGEIINQITQANSGTAVTSAHSQGTLMTQNGLDIYQEDLADTVQNNSNARFLVQYSGSPVGGTKGGDLVTDIYGGEDILNEKTKNGISDIYRSHTNPGDPVSVFLGGNSAGVNNQEGYIDNFMYAITRGVPSIANGTGVKDKDGNYIKDPSPHSGYPCVIGCGDNMDTPQMDFYYTPDKDDGTNETPLSNFYIDIKTDPSKAAPIQKPTTTNQIIIDTTKKRKDY